MTNGEVPQGLNAQTYELAVVVRRRDGAALGAREQAAADRVLEAFDFDVTSAPSSDEDPRDRMERRSADAYKRPPVGLRDR